MTDTGRASAMPADRARMSRATAETSVTDRRAARFPTADRAGPPGMTQETQ